MKEERGPLRRHSLRNRVVWTDSLKERGVKSGSEFARYTNDVYRGLFGTDAKGLRRQLAIPKNVPVRDGLPGEWLALLVLTESRIAILLGDQNISVTEAITRVVTYFVTMP